MSVKKYDHVIYILRTPDGCRYAYHEVLSDYHQYQQKYWMPHCGKQLQVNTNYKNWSNVCNADSYYKEFKLVTKQELIELYDNAYPQSPAERITSDDDKQLLIKQSKPQEVYDKRHQHRVLKNDVRKTDEQFTTNGVKFEQKQGRHTKNKIKVSDSIQHGSEQLNLL